MDKGYVNKQTQHLLTENARLLAILDASLCKEHQTSSGLFAYRDGENVTPGGGGCMVCIGHRQEAEIEELREQLAETQALAKVGNLTCYEEILDKLTDARKQLKQLDLDRESERNKRIEAENGWPRFEVTKRALVNVLRDMGILNRDIDPNWAEVLLMAEGLAMSRLHVRLAGAEAEVDEENH